MKFKKIVIAIATITVMITLAGCAPQANQIGAFIPVPFLSSLIAGFLQGAFVLFVLFWNLLSFVFPIGHFDAYQDGAGPVYDIGFIIGLVLRCWARWLLWLQILSASTRINTTLPSKEASLSLKDKRMPFRGYSFISSHRSYQYGYFLQAHRCRAIDVR